MRFGANSAASKMKKLEQVVSAAQRALEDPADFLELVEKHVGGVEQLPRTFTSAACVFSELSFPSAYHLSCMCSQHCRSDPFDVPQLLQVLPKKLHSQLWESLLHVTLRCSEQLQTTAELDDEAVSTDIHAPVLQLPTYTPSFFRQRRKHWN